MEGPKILRETKHSCFFSEKMSSLPPHLDYVSLYQTRTAKKKEKEKQSYQLESRLDQIKSSLPTLIIINLYRERIKAIGRTKNKRLFCTIKVILKHFF